jgi:hypothetical protein
MEILVQSRLSLKEEAKLFTEEGFVKKVHQQNLQPHCLYLLSNPQKCYWFESMLPPNVEEGSYEV